jgi:signal transduction histidine kinase
MEGMTTEAFDDALWPPLAMAYRVSRRRPLLFDVVLVVLLDLITVIPLILGPEDRWWVWVLDQALILPLLARRRWPVQVFGLLAGLAFLQWLLNDPLAADAGLLLALYTIACHQPRSRALISAGILEVGVVLASVRFAPASDGLAGSLVFLSGLVLTALLAGIALSTHGAYLASMIERTHRLEYERDQQARLAAIAERTRIAREMHDIIAHNISVIIALADGAALSNGTGAIASTDAMRTVSETGRQALVEMRRLLGVLRDDTGSASGFAPQPGLYRLGELVAKVRTAGLPVELTVTGRPSVLSATAEATVYRIVQEGLTNILKHASRPTRVSLVLAWTDDALCLEITDDGEPRRPDRSDVVIASDTGHGLSGMAERVALFAGSVGAGPMTERGWQVRARLPFDPSVVASSVTAGTP